MGIDDRILFFIIGAVIVLAAVVAVAIIKRLRMRPLPMDEMEGHDFEYYCADILKARGFMEVEVTKGSGDFGADILAEKDGVTYAIQCKCYDKPIGVKAVQEVYAGRDYYDRMVGVVMTNQYFTQPAVELAQKLKIMLWDRGYLDAMKDEDINKHHGTGRW
jgi:restriction system protein